MHQVPGVEVCLIHNIILQKTELGTGHHYCGLVSAEEAVKTKINNYLELSDVNLKYFIQLAHNVDWLLKYPNAIFFGDSVRKIYIKLLYKKYGEFNFKDKKSLAKLINDFREYYSPPFLKMLQCDFARHSNWLIDMFILDGKIRHPLRHLLLIIFFESTVEYFFKTSLKYKPFGTEYCPCINRGGEYFQQLLIKDKYQHTDYSNSTKAVTEFCCICDFVSFNRDFDIINKYQVPIATKKIEYGYAWEYALKMLWQNRALNFTEIAQYLGVSEETIERQVGYLKLPLLRRMPNK
ncbi:TnsD family Tn7-like transposition protein [Nostoc punctiforme]|uniref:TnsD family Tn7-like transposition protein n=1 Tax=Nostoc punctiforme TaxID=272131 RepID=UPI000A0144DD